MLERSKAVYALLADLGLRTTKSVWPIRGKGTPLDNGATAMRTITGSGCRAQRHGFEIGYHMAAAHTSPREETVRGLSRRLLRCYTEFTEDRSRPKP